jgi:PTS system nitrogen regulatory IIA component
MDGGDFDLEGLAEYLHLPVADVARLVERGKIPGRRVGGDWRFARPEISLWLEQRINDSNDAELEHIENAVEQSRNRSGEALLAVSDLLTVETIAIPLAARTRNSVIASMVDLAAESGGLWDVPKMAEAVRSREELYPTALDNGVALLHPRRTMPAILDRPLLALGLTSQGIPFARADGKLTDIFFLICSISDRGHLHTLARLSRLVNDADFLAELRSAPDAAAALETITRREAQVLG